MPVITAVVYYGKKPWDGATTLHGMLDILGEMKTYVNDHKTIPVEARQNSLTFSDRNNIGRLCRKTRFLDKRKNVKYRAEIVLTAHLAPVRMNISKKF